LKIKPVRPEAGIFGKRLRSLRLERGLTQEHLAELAGITATYTSDLERGAKVPSLTILLRLARAFDLTVGELLSDFRREVVQKLRLD
jgi:transcriptional regulator with XRE-family HTH domain